MKGEYIVYTTEPVPDSDCDKILEKCDELALSENGLVNRVYNDADPNSHDLCVGPVSHGDAYTLYHMMRDAGGAPRIWEEVE